MSTGLPRLVHLASGQLRDVPEDDRWLSEEECVVLARLKLEKRRTEWRLGRWLARQAVHSALAAHGQQPGSAGSATDAEPGASPRPELPRIRVLAAPDGAPEVHGLAQPVSLTVSHSHGHGLAAALLGETPIGADLELVEPRSERFIRDWLTGSESAHVQRAPAHLHPLLANLCWSAKEAASKVLRVGLRFDTRAFDVALPDQVALERAARDDAWAPIAVTAVKSGERFQGLWRARGDFVETVLAKVVFEIRI